MTLTFWPASAAVAPDGVTVRLVPEPGVPTVSMKYSAWSTVPLPAELSSAWALIATTTLPLVTLGVNTRALVAGPAAGLLADVPFVLPPRRYYRITDDAAKGIILRLHEHC